jgi:quercetin dioxygenase-like cupin family protein
MKYTYPHTIDNGSGEELTFVNLVKDNEGDWLEVVNKVRPGAGPPLHVHYFQDECLTVVQGKIGVHVPGRPDSIHGVGETVLFKKGEVHRFWNAGDEQLICKGWIKPADNIVYFLSEIFQSTKVNGGHRPALFDGAYLGKRYGSEFDLIGIPTFVKKVIFPIVLTFGKLSGKHKKFAGAPEPRR